jgi:hypothetical protein
MNNLSGPIIVEEDASHFLVGIHYNDRHLAREIEGRAWNGEKRRWTWIKSKKNYENLTKTFEDIAERFEISDKDLIKENQEREINSVISEENQEQGDWDFLSATDDWLQVKQLQRIEDKIDELLKSIYPSSENKEDTETRPDNKQKAEHEVRNDSPMPWQAQEIIASLTSDETFNELILRREANQSPIQRLHNKIRDEIRSYKIVEDEEIHQGLTKYFLDAKKSPYTRGDLGLVQLTWFAEAGKFYGPKRNKGPLDIYQMLHFFNKMRVEVEKYDQSSEEMSRIHAVSCLALGRIIWSRIRMRSIEEEKGMTEPRETEQG